MSGAAGARVPRILWVTEEPPDRNLGGGNIRQAHLFEALARAYPVDLVVSDRVSDPVVRASAASVRELSPPAARWSQGPVGRRVFELTLALGYRFPVSLWMAGPARRALAEVIEGAGTSYDLVCVEHEALAPMIDRRSGARWLLTFHNLLSGIAEAELGLAPGPRQAWYRRREHDKARDLERSALRDYDTCLVSSPEDARALEELRTHRGGAHVAVIPNGVDTERLKPSPLPAEPRVLFPGTFAYPPNIDGAVWFCEEIWPRVREAIPGAVLDLAGRSPAARVRELSELPGVKLHPNVPSMARFFAATRVVVVPLRIGTGTRLKALEAMAAGRPVVGTSTGLEGIGARHEVNALVADNPGGFAQAVVRLLHDEKGACAIARTARAHVEAHYSWRLIGAEFVREVAALLEG